MNLSSIREFKMNLTRPHTSLKKECKREVVKKTDIPKKFIRKIKKVGLKEEDAGILYGTKIDWEAVYAENKLYCAETGCDFVTEIDNSTMKKHTKDAHGFNDYPCEVQYCNYIGYSKKNLNIHNKMHTKRSGFYYTLRLRLVSKCENTFRETIWE